MKTDFRLKKIAIIGLGLMGGSLGLAVKKKRIAETVSGFARRRKTRRDALAARAVDEAPSDPAQTICGAEMVVFCAPVDRIIGLVEECMPFFQDSCIVTDVGSSKRKIVARLDSVFRKSSAFFIGGHPIAGSERKGFNAACPDLYENASVILTPTGRTDRNALQAVRKFWTALDARVKLVSPAEHDKLIARTSHLPHMLAAMLASNAWRGGAERTRDFCGTGFRDTTRIAEGDPGLWMEIVSSNSAAIAKELDIFGQQLERVKKMAANNDRAALRRFLEKCRERRRQLVSPD